jgi:hypothetical protein
MPVGQIIQLQLSVDPYPERRSGLEDPEAVLLIGLRWWAEDTRLQHDPLPRLRQGMAIAGLPDSALAIDAFMTIAGRTAYRALEVHGPGCDCLSPDEKHLLHAASLVQAGHNALAERALRTTLLTAQGADMALGPLMGIGQLFSSARLFFRRRAVSSNVGGARPAEAKPHLFAATIH